MQRFQLFGLSLQLLRLWDDNNHIGSLSSMIVLIGDTTHQHGFIPCCRQVRGALRLCGINGDIVQPDRSATTLRSHHDMVDGLQIRYAERFLFRSHHFQTAIVWYPYRSYFLVIYRYQHSSSTFSSEVYRNLSLSRGSCRTDFKGIALVCHHFPCIIKVPTTMIPCIVVYLVQGAIVIIQGVISCQELFRAYHGRLLVILRQEVIAIVGIRVTHALMV